MRRRIEGRAESPVVVVDDVVTTGSSALEAIEYLQDQEEFQIGYLLTLVYRGTKELEREIEEKYGVKLLYIFHEDDFTQQ
jgi:orotate phosphoribosyltransferase